MEIWYHDRNFDGALNSFTYIAGNVRGVNLRNVSNLGQANGEGKPDYFFINPFSLLNDEYWGEIKRCVDVYPGTRFLILALDGEEQSEVIERVIGSPDNVELLELDRSLARRLNGILKMAS